MLMSERGYGGRTETEGLDDGGEEGGDGSQSAVQAEVDHAADVYLIV